MDGKAGGNARADQAGPTAVDTCGEGWQVADLGGLVAEMSAKGTLLFSQTWTMNTIIVLPVAVLRFNSKGTLEEVRVWPETGPLCPECGTPTVKRGPTSTGHSC
jgi:hypothetical protein